MTIKDEEKLKSLLTQKEAEGQIVRVPIKAVTDAHEKDIALMKQTIDALLDSVDGLKGRVTALENSVEDLKARVTEIEEKNRSLSSTINKLSKTEARRLR